MKALTLTQPWATMVALGLKKIETRSWSTAYRGALAIHAAKSYPRWARDFAQKYELENLPFGAVIAVCELVNIETTGKATPSPEEEMLGDYTPGRFAWYLSGVRALLAPVPCRGMLGIWEMPSDALAALGLPPREEV